MVKIVDAVVEVLQGQRAAAGSADSVDARRTICGRCSRRIKQDLRDEAGRAPKHKSAVTATCEFRGIRAAAAQARHRAVSDRSSSTSTRSWTTSRCSRKWRCRTPAARRPSNGRAGRRSTRIRRSRCTRSRLFDLQPADPADAAASAGTRIAPSFGGCRRTYAADRGPDGAVPRQAREGSSAIGWRSIPNEALRAAIAEYQRSQGQPLTTREDDAGAEAQGRRRPHRRRWPSAIPRWRCSRRTSRASRSSSATWS